MIDPQRALKPSKDPRSNRIKTECQTCNTVFYEKPSSHRKKARHFCSSKCYAAFRRDQLPFYEQHAYKGVRKIGDPEWVYSRNFRKARPEVISHLKAKRYAQQKGAKGSHTLQEWEELKKRHNHRCAACKEAKPLTKDHMTPLSRGGSNNIDNIQPLCRNCNSQKNTKTQEQWEAHLAKSGDS